MNYYDAILHCIREDNLDRLREMQPDGEMLKVMKIRILSILSYMLVHGSVNMIRYFALELKADLNARIVVDIYYDELPPLCACVHEPGEYDTGKLLRSMECLIQLGADINVRDRKGKTALCIAIQKGFVQGVSLLVASGADRYSAEKVNREWHLCCERVYIPNRYMYANVSAWKVLRYARLSEGVRAEIQFQLDLPELILAFAMGRHPRLGRESPVALLDGGVLRKILSLL